MIAAVVRDRPGECVEDHFEPEFEPVAEVVSAVTPDQWRNATAGCGFSSLRPRTRVARRYGGKSRSAQVCIQIRQPGRGFSPSSIPDLERSAQFRLRSLSRRTCGQHGNASIGAPTLDWRGSGHRSRFIERSNQRLLMRAVAHVVNGIPQFSLGGSAVIALVYIVCLLPGCLALACTRARWPWVLFRAVVPS
jgi:hypothetical protein